VLAPTPPDKLVDENGRPYFLWDCDVTLELLRTLLTSDDREERAYWAGKVMRQAKPDDALILISPAQMRALWPDLERFLGKTKPFWAWLLERLS